MIEMQEIENSCYHSFSVSWMVLPCVSSILIKINSVLLALRQTKHTGGTVECLNMEYATHY